MAGLQMPKKGQGAEFLRQLQDEDRAVEDRDNDRAGEEKTEDRVLPAEAVVPLTLSSPQADEQIETNVTTLQRPLKGSNEATNVLSKDTMLKASNVSSPVAYWGQQETERMSAALTRAQADEISVVTVRAPQKLNTYIDRYVERVNRVNSRRKYRKQDAVAEMFAWFYASHPMPPAPDEEDL